MKLQIKSIAGKLLYEAEAATISELLCLAVKDGADLSSADLHSADLSFADLRSADLSFADLRSADLRSADLDGATIIETGETWAVYLASVVPALLTAGGKALADVLTLANWECHSWDNCPMAAAFSAHSVEGVPLLLKPRAEQFIRYFDAQLIPLEAVGKAAA